MHNPDSPASMSIHEEAMIVSERPMMESDQERRKQLVWEIERKLAEDNARPIIFYDRRATC